MKISTWELMTAGRGAFRAAGLAFGSADSAARMLKWSQAVEMEALAWLVSNYSLVEAGAKVDMELIRDEQGQVSIDAGGQCVFVAGQSALDMACADAAHAGVGFCVVSNCAGAGFSGYLAYRGALRGYHSIVLSVQERSVVLRLALPGEESMCLLQRPVDDVASLAQLAGLSVEQTPVNSGLTVICRKSSHRSSGLPGAELVNVAERLAIAARGGYATDDGVANEFLALGRRALVPTSKRSRQQAGE